MFEYRKTEKFDIGSGYGELEYDFFTITSEDDFRMLMNHYGAFYKRFDYFLDGYETIENNTVFSPVVQAKMKEHNANLCLTLLEEGFKENNIGIRQMIVNEQKPNGIYETFIFYLYHFRTVRARDYLERGLAYAKSDLHIAAIRHFSRAIKLDPSMGLVFSYRGISYLNRNEYDNAIDDFTQSINFNSDESKLFSLRGLAYKEAGDFEKARADFGKALKLNPDDKMAKECLDEMNKA
jgi:tetratricopeptide (TPR) repeat protein